MNNIKQKILIVGHISLDYRFDDILLGGPPLYQIPVLSAMGYEIDVLTSFAKKEYYLLKKYPQVKFIVIPSPVTTTFEFKYYHKSQPHLDDRVLVLQKKANQIQMDQLNQISANYDKLIISPIAGEVSEEVMANLIPRAQISFIDIQGIVRSFDDKGIVRTTTSLEKLERICEKFSVVKASVSELPANYEVYVKKMSEGALIVTNSGNDIKLFTPNGFSEIEVDKSTQIIDDTGSGDIYLAAVAGLLSRFSLEESLKLAHDIAKSCLMIKGLPSTQDVGKILSKLNLI